MTSRTGTASSSDRAKQEGIFSAATDTSSRHQNRPLPPDEMSPPGGHKADLREGAERNRSPRRRQSSLALGLRPRCKARHRPRGKRVHAALLTPQKNGSGPFVMPLTWLRHAWWARKNPVGA